MTNKIDYEAHYAQAVVTNRMLLLQLAEQREANQALHKGIRRLRSKIERQKKTIDAFVTTIQKYDVRLFRRLGGDYTGSKDFEHAP